MDIQLLRKSWPRFSTIDLESVMRPRLEIEGVIKCNPLEFFNLELIEIGNLYRADKTSIWLRHESSLVISKCEGKLQDSLVFHAEFDNKFFFECGINYLGRIRILKPEAAPIAIRVFGEGSYDPASTEPYLSKHDYVVINGFVVTALYACKRGGSAKLVEKVFKVASKNISCKNHSRLVEYMKYQILNGVINAENSVDYATYLKHNKEAKKFDLLNKENEDYLTFLNVLEIYEKTEIFPSKKYIDSLVEIRKPDSEIIEFMRKTPEVYLRLNTEYIESFYQKEFVDLRNLENIANVIEKKYADKIKAALEARGEHIENPNMSHLTTNYYTCSTF